MTALSGRYSDLLESDHDAELVALVGRLDAMRYGSPSPRADLTIRRSLISGVDEQACPTAGSTPPRIPMQSQTRRGLRSSRVAIRFPRRTILRAAGLAAPLAAAVAITLVVGSLLMGGAPTPASAATILRHAQTAGLAAGEITRFDYQITNSGGFGGSVSVWLQAGTNGQPVRMTYSPQPQYGPAGEWVCPTKADCYANISTRFLVGSYEDIVGKNSPASLTGSQVKGQQTFDGVLCDVVRAPSGATLYFDARTYVLEGASWTDLEQGGAQQGQNSTWDAQLSHSGTVASPTAGLPWWYIVSQGFSNQPPDQSGPGDHVAHRFGG
jgi:hypothetical protein